MPKQANLPYSKADKVFNEYGRNILTGEKNFTRKEWEKLAGTDDDTLTNQQLIDIINNKNDEAFKNRFRLVLVKIEETLYPEALEKLIIENPEFDNYQPFQEAIRLWRKNFKELK